MEMDAASMIENTVSAAILDHAKAPRSETQSLHDPTMLPPTKADYPSERKGKFIQCLGRVQKEYDQLGYLEAGPVQWGFALPTSIVQLQCMCTETFGERTAVDLE